MSKIRQILESLPIEDQEALKNAFDNQEPYYVILNHLSKLINILAFPAFDFPKDEPLNYIGVNIDGFKNLKEDEKHGEWSLGRVIDNVNQSQSESS